MIQPLKHYPEFYPELPGWKFEIDEVSANVYEVVGTDKLGHQVSSKGFDLDELVEQCKKYASEIESASGATDAQAKDT